MTDELLSIRDLKLQKGSNVFIRCDFNVPMDEFLNITDDRRIKSALPTIKYCIDQGCKIVLASHLGRPKNGFEEKFSLKSVAKRLSTLLQMEIEFACDISGNDANAKFQALKDGEILLLENLRFDKGETKNDQDLAKNLSKFGEFYINDAFGVCHRAHASVEAITDFYDDFHKAAGFLLIKEINFASNLIKRPARPFVAVVGGSKVSGKLQALNNLITKVDKLIIGGGMAFTFLKAIGYNIGNSLLEEDLIDDALNILRTAKKLGVKIYLPIDAIVAPACSQESVMKYVTTQEIPSDWMGLDIGPASVVLFREALEDAQTIWWNGPMGVFEIDKFAKGSLRISHAIAESHATTVVGGGDTADVVARAGDSDYITFISTGGGASLELIEGKELPSVKPLLRAKN